MDLQGAVQGTYRVQFQVDRVLEGSGIFTVLHEGQQVSTALLPLLRVRWGLPTLPPAASALAALHKQDSCNTLHQVLMGPPCTNRTAAIIIMYIYHALMIHINLNIFYTHVKHSPTKTIYIKYYKK